MHLLLESLFVRVGISSVAFKWYKGSRKALMRRLGARRLWNAAVLRTPFPIRAMADAAQAEKAPPKPKARAVLRRGGSEPLRLDTVQSSPAQVDVLHGLIGDSLEADPAFVGTEVDPEYQKMPIDQLCELLLLYLRTCRIPSYLSPVEESRLFPSLFARIDECPVDTLLDILDCIWPAQTRTRYVKQFRSVFREKILKSAADFTPLQVARTIVVLGMGTGFNRDLEVFTRLGKLLVHHVNEVKEPEALVSVLSALARAKIIPSGTFLSLLSRRFPVLNKKTPIGPETAYRAFAQFYKMRYPQMPPYRFMADRVMKFLLSDLKEESTTVQSTTEQNRTPSTETVSLEDGTQYSVDVVLDDDPKYERGEDGEVLQRDAAELAKERQLREERAAAQRESVRLRLQHVLSELPPHDKSSIPSQRTKLIVRQRFRRATHLKSAQLVKLLWILSILGAPRQQYLRPLAETLLLPMIPYLSPPTFSRLIRTLRTFASDDSELIQAVLDRLVAQGPEGAIVGDVAEALRILGLESVPQLIHEPFFTLCRDVFADDSKLRARDMCLLAADLVLITRKLDGEHEDAVKPLFKLLETFAGRMSFLIDLGVLSLTHAEVLLEICQQLKVPDDLGNIARLSSARRRVSDEGENEYYMQIDVDVREIFFRTQVLNHWATYGSYRPLPAQMFHDYRMMLQSMRVDFIVEAVHLYGQAYPNTLITPLQRVLSKYVLSKMHEDGEEVIADGMVMLVQKPPVPFTDASLTRFCNVLLATPLKRVREATTTWEFVHQAAKKIGHSAVAEKAISRLAEIRAKHTGSSSES